MNLSKRISTVHKESGLSQREFASSIGVTESYISLLLKGKTEKISEPLSMLIECKYGYSAKWIMTGEGKPKEPTKKNTFIREKAKHLIDQLDENGLAAVEAFINSMDDLKKEYERIKSGEESATAETIAAHNDAELTEEELELMNQDIDEL